MASPAIYTGTFIHCNSHSTLSIQHSTAVGVDANGKIVFIEPYSDVKTDIPRFAAQHSLANYRHIAAATTRGAQKVTSFFFPGFIDTHTHAPQYPNTGIFGSSTLLDWLETYTFPLEASFSDLARARTVYTRVVARALSHATTTAAYYATAHVPATNLLADICLAAGQRALIGRVCMDRLSPPSYRDASPAAAVAATEACIAHIAAVDPAATFIRPVITPRFAPSCTTATLAALGALSAANPRLPVQTHISENTAELALVAELFPDAADYASVYDAAGLLSDRTILAHAVHLSPAEIQLIAARGAKISHCPASNTCLTSGAARAKTLRDAGIDVGLGTDMSGGFSPSILEMTRQAVMVSRHAAMGGDDGVKLAVEEALWFATVGGAKVVGLEGVVGAYEVGMEWDAQMVCLGVVDGADGVVESDVGPVDVFGWESWEDTVAKWVYCGDDRNVGAVWVKGRCVHDRVGVLS